MSFRPGLLIGIGLLVSSAVYSAATEDARLAESRVLVDKFASTLGTALQSAIREDGLVGAISACRDLAPQIASSLSRESGAGIGRTSHRWRNPGNAPEPWQSVVLHGFENDADLSEFFAVVDGHTRYMKAIRLAPMCLGCHGSVLDPAVEALLDAEYPHDLARDYEAGDLRGAFSVSWPAEP